MSHENVTSTARARVCDTCRSNPGLIFCESDMAYLCVTCDSQIHSANKLSSRHKRVPVCNACERAPAALICKADHASLCATCDAAIHSENTLSRRHHRVPVMPVVGSVYGHSDVDIEPWSVFGLAKAERTMDNADEDEAEAEAASWLVVDSPAKIGQGQNSSNNDQFLCNGDEFMELGDYNSLQDSRFSNDFKFDEDYKYMNDGTNTILHHYSNYDQQQMYGGCDTDSLVPVQSADFKKYDDQLLHHNFQNMKFEYESSINGGGYGYFGSLGGSVSMSSLEVGSIDLLANPAIQTPAQLTAIDREARVLRYKEKKKTRKFEKTIRYASRKACADTKPRIQGRFAKRTSSDIIERDQMFSRVLMKEDEYSSVHSI